MMLLQRIEKLEKEMRILQNITLALPKWIPLTKHFSKQYGYTTTNGLRNWCERNLSNEEFKKQGRFWYINKDALAKLSLKIVS